MNISCIIPLYNASKYISEALDSLLNQSYGVFEIVVVDDCSQDDSVKIVEKYINNNNKIKLIKQTQNKGASAARNRGLEEATGDWILFMDADDCCEESLLKNYVNYIQCAEETDMIYSQFLQIDKNNQPISQPMIGKTLKGGEGFCNMILRNPIIAPSGILVKRDITKQLNGFDESIKYVEDVDLWLRILLAGKTIAYLDIPGSKIRRHSANTTNAIEITNIGENMLLDKFGLSLIKEKIYESQKPLNEKHLDYINILIRFKKFNLALDLLNELKIEKNDKNYLSHLFIKARIYLHYNDIKNAKLIYEEIITIDSNHGATLNNLGVIAAMDGLFDKAKEYFGAALKLFSNYLDVKHNLTCLEHGTNDFKFTYRELRKSLLNYS